MSVLILLIFASLGIATLFLFGFFWAVRSGQYEDTCTPSLRLLTEDAAESTIRTKPASTGPEMNITFSKSELPNALSKRSASEAKDRVGENASRPFNGGV